MPAPARARGPSRISPLGRLMAGPSGPAGEAPGQAADDRGAAPAEEELRGDDGPLVDALLSDAAEAPSLGLAELPV